MIVPINPEQIEQVNALVRSACANCHDGCCLLLDDDDKRTELLSRRDDCTTLLKQLRKEKRVAQTIIEDNPKIKENIRIETQAINKAYELDTKQKYYKRSYER